MVDLAQLEIRIKSLEAVDANRRLGVLATTSNRLDKGIASLVKQFAAFGSALAVIAAARDTVRTIADIERGLVAIQKTTDVTNEELKDIAKSFRELAAEIDTPLVKLLQLGAAAGQLGVRGSSNIVRFAQTVAQLEQATSDVRGEEAALALARLLNLAGEGVETVERLGSVIVRLGNNFAATEGEIVNAATFIGQAAAVFDVTSAEVAAISTAVAATGQRAQTAATSIGRSFVQIDRAVSNGGESLQRFADIAGVSIGEFSQLFRQDATGALVAFLSGVGRLVDEGANISDVLESVDIGGLEAVRSLGALASRTDILADALAQARQEYATGTALADEFSRSQDTLTAAFGRFGNAITLVQDAIGQGGLLGGMRGLVDLGAGVLRVLGGVATESDRSSFAVEALALAVRGLVSALIALTAVSITRFLLSFAGGVRQAVETFRLASAPVQATTLAVNAFSGELQTVAVATPHAARGLAGLWAVVRANPVGVVITLVSTFAAILGTVASRARDAAAANRTLQDALSGLEASLRSIERAQANLALARFDQDRQAEITALEELIASLRQAREEINALDRAGGRTSLESLGTIQGITAEDVADLTNRLEGDIATAVARGLAEGIASGDISGAPDEFELRFAENVKNSLSGTGLEDLVDFDLVFKRFRTGSNQLNRELLQAASDSSLGVVDGTLRQFGQSFARLREELAALVDGTIVSVPAESALFTVQEQIDAVQRELEKLRDPKSASGGGIISDEDLDKLKEITEASQNLESTLVQDFQSIRDAIVDITSTDFEALVNQPLREIQRTADALYETFEGRAALGEIIDLEAQREALDAFVDEAEGKLRDLARLNQIRGVAEGVGSAVGNGITDAIFGAEDALRQTALAAGRAVVGGVVDAALVQPLVAELTKIGADLFGIALDAAPIIAASTSAASILTGGGVAAGEALIAAATTAAGILASQQTANAVATVAAVAVRQGAVFAGAPVAKYNTGGIAGLDRGTSSTIAAAGMIINQPTLMPQALIGEGHRAEGVFPLDKTSGGGLGIMAQIGAASALLPVGRLADGNLGVKVSGLQTGGLLNSPGIVPQAASFGRIDTRTGEANNNGDGRSLSINVTIREPTSRDTARRSGAIIGRKIAEALR